MQNTQMQYLVISFIGDNTLNILEIESAVSFENLLFKKILRHILYMKYPFGNLLSPVAKQKQGRIGCFSFE